MCFSTTRYWTSALLVAVVVAAAAALAAQQIEEERRCCFTNRAYTGTCVVVPAEDESCADILAWLNDPNSTGKTYCNNTPLRGGWMQVDCEPEGSMGGGAGP